jgi:large subunit ribosomal protein L29
MATKKFKEMKELTVDELKSRLRTSESELFQTKIKHATGQLADTASIWRLRKDIARMKMLQGQKTQAQGKMEAKGK